MEITSVVIWKKAVNCKYDKKELYRCNFLLNNPLEAKYNLLSIFFTMDQSMIIFVILCDDLNLMC